MEKSKRPSFIGHYKDFMDEDNAYYEGSDELLAIGSAVGKKLGLVKIGIHIETILSGRRTSWPHAESEEEEFAFVIKGKPDVWINGVLYPLAEGDFVAFPSGTGIAHVFLNNTYEEVILRVGGEKTKSENKIYYPMHPARTQKMKEKGCFWENPPQQTMGDHDGEPKLPRISEIKIETSRLILRTLKMSDASSIFDYAQNDNVTKHLLWSSHKTLKDSESFIKDYAFPSYMKNQPEPLGICLKENPDKVIGTVGAFWVSVPSQKMELACALSEKYWGQGLIVEAMKAISDYCFAHYEVKRLQAQCKSENSQSFKMLTKIGMTHEGTLKSFLFSKGKFCDMEMFSLIR
jgi:RimJ/RimL family protein N-acetyltransferase/uncharacterized cupin superfamily protein